MLSLPRAWVWSLVGGKKKRKKKTKELIEEWMWACKNHADGAQRTDAGEALIQQVWLQGWWRPPGQESCTPGWVVPSVWGPSSSWPCFQPTVTFQWLWIGSTSHFSASDSDRTACPVSLGNHSDPITHVQVALLSAFRDSLNHCWNGCKRSTQHWPFWEP